MRLNGNLVLNAGGSSEIQNAVIQRLSSLPTAVSAEKGRFVYNTTDGKVYYNDNGSWVALATGGNAALLQAEVDALEAALGSLVGTDGAFVAPATGIFAAATSVSGVIEIIKTTMAAETAARVAADAAETTARVAADADLQTAITAETTRATAAEGTLTTNLAAEVTRATAAEGTLTTNLATETAAREAADTALQASITAEATARAAADTAINAKLGKIFFLYNGASATSHVVGHALNQKYCNVTVVDATADEVIIPQAIVFDSANQLTVTLNSALAIKVVVMGIGPVA